ncbi:hypothetical protein GGI1_10515 [Acidithiobacillus sp. GGI-221]|nr:hypothetical protein GGI1_10515 [Acidithiobacillus sp. GGI-221]
MIAAFAAGKLPACVAGPLAADWRMLLNPPGVSAQAFRLKVINPIIEMVRNG